jgi:hypothetical protein
MSQNERNFNLLGFTVCNLETIKVGYTVKKYNMYLYVFVSELSYKYRPTPCHHAFEVAGCN